jgi:hypothetical protein
MAGGSPSRCQGDLASISIGVSGTGGAPMGGVVRQVRPFLPPSITPARPRTTHPRTRASMTALNCASAAFLDISRAGFFAGNTGLRAEIGCRACQVAVARRIVRHVCATARAVAGAIGMIHRQGLSRWILWRTPGPSGAGSFLKGVGAHGRPGGQGAAGSQRRMRRIHD